MGQRMAGLDAAEEVGAHGVMLHLVGLPGGFACRETEAQAAGKAGRGSTALGALG